MRFVSRTVGSQCIPFGSVHTTAKREPKRAVTDSRQQDGRRKAVSREALFCQSAAAAAELSIN